MASDVAVRVRLAGLDRLRGLAMVAMLVDHLMIVGQGPNEVRMTVGRLAMPLFFLIAGSLFSRLSWRHAAIWGVGLVLPLFVPWVDAPNVLYWYAFGVVALWVCDRLGPSAQYVVLVCCLTLWANGLGTPPPGAYPFWALLALMIVGRLIGREALGRVGDHLPAWSWLELVGRFPLTFYVVHLLILQTVVLSS